MITKEEYLGDPCRTASVPYWKAVRIAVPGNMKILHEDDFCAEMWVRYTDEPYFRLRHDLQVVGPVTIPEGFSLRAASVSVFADHINSCYGGVCVTEDELQNYCAREVYCPELWVAIQDDRTGKTVATGIGELDADMGEGILEWIQVSDGYRGRGLGICIVKELLWRMRDKAEFATVSGQCNNPANPEALYRKCGFTGNDVWHVLCDKVI